MILDFVPAHFALDDYALADFDGTALYEYPHSDVGHSEWGSRNFIHSRGEVRSFLQSCALYWLKEYHFDGLRMDAVRNLIYWQGDEHRGENRSAIHFLQSMNRGLKERFPTAMLIAEDSSSRKGITAPAEAGDYKWDLGWMSFCDCAEANGMELAPTRGLGIPQQAQTSRIRPRRIGRFGVSG